ncbi:MAG: HdeA/HdeB family chaperone [Hyphomicrobium sp.]
MLRIHAALAAVLVAVGILPATASAEKIDLSTVSCDQLIQSVEAGSENDKSGMAGILYWIAGYSATEEQGSVVDFKAMAKDFEKILTGCRQQPGVGVLTMSGRYMGENATEHGAEAVDLKTMTCQAAITSNPSDSEGLGYILMWIAGHQASDSEDPIFDTDTFGTDMEHIGTYCGSNPSVGLLTASDEVMGTEDASE